MPRSTAPRPRSGPRNGSRTTKGSGAKRGRTAKGRRRSSPRRGFRAALLVVLVIAGVVTWPAAEKHLSALPYLDSIIAALTSPSAPA